MPSTRYRIGLLFSTEGVYGAASIEILKGARLAIEQVNAAGEIIIPIEADPEGRLARYTELCAGLLDRGVRHVVGCYTSQSRKEVIPVIEKRDALLWYPAHYEGFESSPNVVYTGAAPNQHVVPLIEFASRNYRLQACCVGSNYVWAWETNRVLREAVQAGGGRILSERYVPLDETDLSQIVAEIMRLRPAFVFCTLVGQSGVQFILALRAACLAAGIDQPASMPVLSCNLSDVVTAAAGSRGGDGHVSSNTYFSTIDTPANAAFVGAYRARFGGLPTADSEAAYTTVRLLAQALEIAGTDDVDAVRRAVTTRRLQAPQGEVWIDPETMHAALTPRIGRSRHDGTYEILWESPRPILPDPYLVRAASPFATPALRLVS